MEQRELEPSSAAMPQRPLELQLLLQAPARGLGQEATTATVWLKTVAMLPSPPHHLSLATLAGLGLPLARVLVH